MSSRRQKAIRALALVLAFALSQFCVQASAVVPPALAGKLVTRKNKPISVNGNSVASGTTVFSGAQIQTPEAVGATVDLGPLGRLDMAPKTNLTLTFNEASVSVNLQSGYVVLTTNKGIKGSVTNPQGAVTYTDPAARSSVVVSVGTQGPATAGVGAIPAAAIGTAGTASMVTAATGAMVTGAAVSRGRGRSLSPSSPSSQR